MEQNKWLDISDEAYREYIYADHVLRVERPKLLHVAPSSLGGHAHRIQTKDSLAYYVAPGWKAVRWQTYVGLPPFKF